MKPSQNPEPSRTLFIKLIKEISAWTEIGVLQVLEAFIGKQYEEQKVLRSKLTRMVKEAGLRDLGREELTIGGGSFHAQMP